MYSGRNYSRAKLLAIIPWYCCLRPLCIAALQLPRIIKTKILGLSDAENCKKSCLVKILFLYLQ